MNGTIYKNNVNYGVNISDSQPVGQIIESASETTPAGYLPCDGRSLLRSDYPDLFKKIGTTYGAEDDEHFNLPNENQSSNNAILTSSTSDSDSKKVFIYPNFFVSQGVTFKLFFANGNSSSSISVEINENEYALKIYKAGTKSDVYAGMDAGTILEVFFDGTDIVLTSNPIVKQDTSSTSGYTIYADGKNEYWTTRNVTVGANNGQFVLEGFTNKTITLMLAISTTGSTVRNFLYRPTDGIYIGYAMSWHNIATQGAVISLKIHYTDRNP